MAVNDDRLPAVAGDRLPCSLQEFERRCRVHIMWEQDKPLPDNGLIAVLCDGVRLAREQADFLKAVRKIWYVPLTRKKPLCRSCECVVAVADRAKKGP